MHVCVHQFVAIIIVSGDFPVYVRVIGRYFPLKSISQNLIVNNKNNSNNKIVIFM